MDILAETAQRVVRPIGSRFFWILGLLFATGIVADALKTRLLQHDNAAVYDLMMRHRLGTTPTVDVVVVAIDEYSLRALAGEFGRWPWPRSVLGEVIAGLEEAGAAAIALDVLIAEPDVANPDSDLVLDQVVAASGKVVAAAVLQPRELHAASLLRADMIPSASWVGPEEARDETTVAMLLPFLGAMQQSIGTINLGLGDDGVVRQYQPYTRIGDWRIPSLALETARVASGGTVAEAPASITLNWRRSDQPFEVLSFADVYRAPPGELAAHVAGASVVIGATASGLGDITVTPVSRAMPGPLVHATALENLHTRAWIRQLPFTAAVGLSLAAVFALNWAFTRKFSLQLLDALILGANVLVICVSFFLLSFWNVYIDVTGVVTVSVAYFLVARLYNYLLMKSLNGEAAIKSSLLGSRYGNIFGVIFLDGDRMDKKAFYRAAKLVTEYLDHEKDDVYYKVDPIVTDSLLGGCWTGSIIVFVLAADRSALEERLYELSMRLRKLVAEVGAEELSVTAREEVGKVYPPASPEARRETRRVLHALLAT